MPDMISEAGVIPSFGMCTNGGAGAALAMGLQCIATESIEYGIYTNTVVVDGTDGENRFMRDDESYLLHVPARKLMSEDEIAEKIDDILMLTDEKMTENRCRWGFPFPAERCIPRAECSLLVSWFPPLI